MVLTDGLIIEFPEHFDLIHTFECGQNFRFQTFDYGKSYYGPLEDRILYIQQKSAKCLEIHSNITNGLEEKVHSFLRLDDDYLEMQKKVAVDPLMNNIVQTTNGLHMLRQDPFECSISYLLSQCSNIPRIKLHLNELALKFGQQIKYEGHDFYLFPSRSDLISVTEDQFREMKIGYRAKYLVNFIHNHYDFLSKPIEDSNVFNEELQKIDGIGQKVADCIQLFAYGDLNVFPVDTWMSKFMIQYYTHGQKESIKKLRTIGQQMFGKWSGYAQELIFRYARCYDPTLVSSNPKKKRKKLSKKSN